MKVHKFLLLACFLTASALRAHAAKPRTDWAATGTLWESGQYDYDAAGNVKQVGTDRYAYDQYGRLVSATAYTPSSANVQAYTYDRYGNLKSMTTTTASGTFRGAFAVVPSTNRLDGTCEQPYDVCHSRFHNADTGAETGRYAAGEYQWDAVGMLKELDGYRHERHIYDANDERILTIQYTGNVETTRRYSLRGPDHQVLRDLTLNVAANSWTVDHDYVRRGDALMASFTGTDAHPARHYHPDHLGTPRVITDADGYRLNIHTYLPFGREAEGSEPDTERLEFTGHERDSSGPASPGFDLDYMHARFYDPNVGRFLSADPIDDVYIGQPQSWNKYSYVRNNPVRFIDPTGLRCQPGEALGPDGCDSTVTAPDPGPSGSMTAFLSGSSNAHQLERMWKQVTSIRNPVTGLTAGEHWRATGEGTLAFVDGVVPFADPLADIYADSPIHGLEYSRDVGEYTRNLEIAIATAGGTLETRAGAEAGNWVTQNVFRWGKGAWKNSGGPRWHFHLGPRRFMGHHLPHQAKTWRMHVKREIMRKLGIRW